MAAFHFRCTDCERTYAERDVDLVCPDCSAAQAPGRSTRGVLEVVLESHPAAWPQATPTDARFLRSFLPLSPAGTLPPLPAGGTPLLPAERLRRHLGMPRLWLKDDTRNPSGSTKDRASWLVVAKALEYGHDTVAAASTGNTATALAAVAAAAGLRAVVFVPAAAPRAKLVQMLAYGADVVAVNAPYDAAFELCMQACTRFGWYNRNTALNPFTIEGKKTAALEIAAAMAPDVPDVVVVPSGDGVILTGIAKGFSDLRRAGLTDRVPRLVSVQPEGCCALVNALRAGDDDTTPVPDAASVADSIVVQACRNGRWCLRAIRESGGAGVAVPDEAILEAIPELASHTGVFAEPASAATLAGLHAALEHGSIRHDESVVLLITGTGLKDVGSAARAVTMPEAIEPTLEALAARLGVR